MIITILLLTLTSLGVLAVITAIGVARIEHVHPPAGRIIAVDGGRLHVVELGPRNAIKTDSTVVLLHGASGNLEDMRLALGEKLASSYRVVMIDRPGHGWSERLGGDADASPARQADLVAEVLTKLGITRAIIVGHSWSGALATAYALRYPAQTEGLVLISPVTHPWPGGIAWYYNVSTMPVIGPLFANTLMLPLGLALINGASDAAFAPQQRPDDYLRRAAISLVLRPREFLANARDVAGLKDFVTAQAPHYHELRTPTVIITGDRDTTVSPTIHSRAIAAALPNGRLIVLEGLGHGPHHAAPDVVIDAIDELAATATMASEAAQ
jgi:pimeloyl-ACP methyl ester carboxylesterase